MIKALAKRALAPFRGPDRTEWERATGWFADALPDWSAMLERERDVWESARAAASGPEVLLAIGIGGLPQLTMIDSLLAVALTLRGARVHVLLCDTALPACFFPVRRFYSHAGEFARHGPASLICSGCEQSGERVFAPLGLPIHRLGGLLTADDRRRAAMLSREPAFDAIPDCTLEGVPVGDHANASTIRFFASADLSRETTGERVARRYLEATYLSLLATRRLFDAQHFDVISMVHGIYVPHGLIVEAARERGIRIACWCPMYRKRTFVFSHDDTYHQALLVEPDTNWEQLPWTESMRQELERYLKARWYGTEDWFKFVERPQDDVNAIAAAIGIDFSQPTVGLLTNVVWDAQVHYTSNAFKNHMEWLIYTIRYFESRPDLQLLIRVHPGEITGGTPTRQPVLEEIRRELPELPPNVFVVPPESPISTYAAMAQCDSAIIYGTKAGIELVATGLPVIVAGEAWVRNKGLSIDASSIPEYCAALDRLPLRARMSPAQHERAQKYAYHFFFRRWIPLSVLDATNTFYRIGVSSLDDLRPGRSPGLDVICDGLLTGSEFVYPAERFAGATPADSRELQQVAS